MTDYLKLGAALFAVLGWLVAVVLGALVYTGVEHEHPSWADWQVWLGAMDQVAEIAVSSDTRWEKLEHELSLLRSELAIACPDLKK